MLIYLHGCSASGKSTIGNALLNHLDNVILIDQDTYYKKIKPVISFQGDKFYTTANWDTADAIDFDVFNYQIGEAIIQYNWVIVTGFALRDQYMTLKPNLSFLLDIGDHPIEKIIKGRQISKNYKEEKAIKDFYMVQEVVYPYYQETLQNITYNYKVQVYNDERKPIEVLVNEILHYINVSKD